MRRVLLLLLAILVPAFGKDASAQNFIIEKVREIPIDLGDEIVGQISDLAKDAEGNFYLTDRQQHTIWVTDPQGNLIRRIGRQGSGPGELSKPRSGTILEDRILVLDVGNNRISTFSKRGGFLSSFRTNLPGPGNIIAHSDGRIAVSSLMGESLFTVFAPDGKNWVNTAVVCGHRTHQSRSRSAAHSNTFLQPRRAISSILPSNCTKYMRSIGMGVFG